MVATTTFAAAAVGCAGSGIADFMIPPLHNEGMVVDEAAKEAVARLRANGHQASLVGGCVRDFLLGLEPKDWDVATSALPEQVSALFEDSKAVGTHFGVILWRGVEIATFREDGEYSDGRRPDSVKFVTKMKRDAMRRDFTINAMYMDPETLEVIDYFDGQGDLKSKVLSTIGSPFDRIREDYLRIFRAARFAAQFQLNIDGALFSAMAEEADNAGKIAVERVRDELVKILTGPDPGTGLYWLRACDAWSCSPHTQAMLAKLSNPPLSLAVAVFMDQESNPEAELRRLRFPNSLVDTVLAILAARAEVVALLENNSVSALRLAREPWFPDALELFRLRSEQTLERGRELLKRDLWPKPLLSGDDLMRRGIPQGPEIGRLLREIEDAQLIGRVKTKKEALDLITPS